jgi:conjugative transfer signal peptidase TraF
MIAHSRRWRVSAALVVPALLASLALAGESGLSINWSPSVAPGLYWSSTASPQLGEYVKVCPPDREPFREGRRRGYYAAGPCPGSYQPLMKRFAAAKGDRVQISRAGVAVNGRLLPNSAPRALDSRGRPLPQIALDRVLSDGEALVMTDFFYSFDGRYTGPIEQKQIVGKARPLVTWPR